MAVTVQVEVGERSYPICIGRDLLAALQTECAKRWPGGRCLLVTDRHVGKWYASAHETALREAGLIPAVLQVPARESSKSRKWLHAVYDAALAHGMGRRSFMVALGGGVVGDLTGYAAATFMRGIPFVQVPTSLLAMVDSSVGGKTGINLPQGKNLVGAFHQPAAVFADLETLATLPEREYRSGLAEVIKYGIIEDAWFFSTLENQAEALKQRDMETLARVVSRCCEIKSEVVRFDEKECGVRAVLNFGHTFGHALETCSGYGKLLHGEAISIGMVFAAHLSHEVAELSAEDVERIERLLICMGLPVKAPPLDWNELYAVMQKDKKNQRREPLFVLATRIGNVVHGVEASQAIMRRVWEAVLEHPVKQEDAQPELFPELKRRGDG